MEANPETEKTIRQGVQEFADLFLTNDASRAIRQGKGPKRLFKDRTKFGNVIDELKEKGLIDPEAHQRYAMLSQWPHGTSQGMGMVFCNDGKRVSMDTDTCKSLGADAIIIGIRSLGDTALLFNDHFRMDFRDKLMESHKSFSDYLQNARGWGCSKDEIGQVPVPCICLRGIGPYTHRPLFQLALLCHPARPQAPGLPEDSPACMRAPARAQAAMRAS